MLVSINSHVGLAAIAAAVAKCNGDAKAAKFDNGDA